MKILLATVAVLGFATAAQGAEYATITYVAPNYVNSKVPRQRTECQTVEVPIYSNVGGQASTGDTIFGALIGGALGNQVGGGKGKDAMTVLGAIVGADIANKKAGQQQIIGYRQEQSCNNITFYEIQESLKNYTITYTWNGITGRTVTYNNYRGGDRLPVNVSIQAD